MKGSGLSGAGLAEAFHRALVEPLVRSEFLGRSLIGGRFGAGSDVLGFDDDVSTDHDWGLRSTLLVEGAEEVSQFLERELPTEFAGHPVRFALTSDHVVRHRVEVVAFEEFVRGRLGVEPTGSWSVGDWLSFTGQAVLEIVAGPVFTDDDGSWQRLRDKLSWYPDDVWTYLVASSWRQLEQELPFLGRTGSRGDDLGSRVLGARLVDITVHLGFLLDRTWAPYSKWVGSAFADLPSGRVRPDLERALSAPTWPEREAGLCAALETLLRRQFEVGLPVTTTATWPFHGREFRGVVEDLADLVVADVRDPDVRSLPLGVGSISHVCENVDVLVRSDRRRGFFA